MKRHATLVIGALCVVAIIASPLLVEATSFGFHHVPGKFELAVQLTRIMFPFILFVSLAAAVMGLAGTDGQGLSGVELQYDHIARGAPVELHFYHDALGHPIFYDPPDRGFEPSGHTPRWKLRK